MHRTQHIQPPHLPAFAGAYMTFTTICRPKERKSLRGCCCFRLCRLRRAARAEFSRAAIFLFAKMDNM